MPTVVTIGSVISSMPSFGTQDIPKMKETKMATAERRRQLAFTMNLLWEGAIAGGRDDHLGFNSTYLCEVMSTLCQRLTELHLRDTACGGANLIGETSELLIIDSRPVMRGDVALVALERGGDIRVDRTPLVHGCRAMHGEELHVGVVGAEPFRDQAGAGDVVEGSVQKKPDFACGEHEASEVLRRERTHIASHVLLRCHRV